MFEIVKEGDPINEHKYNKFYVGLIKDDRAHNCVAFRPEKSFLLFEPKLPRTDEVDALLEDAGVDALECNSRWGMYRIRSTDKDLKAHQGLFRGLTERARVARVG